MNTQPTVPIPVVSKPFYLSKTVIIAFLQGVAGVLAAVTQVGAIHDVGIGLFLKSILDLVIRSYTTQPLG